MNAASAIRVKGNAFRLPPEYPGLMGDPGSSADRVTPERVAPERVMKSDVRRPEKILSVQTDYLTPMPLERRRGGCLTLPLIQTITIMGPLSISVIRVLPRTFTQAVIRLLNIRGVAAFVSESVTSGVFCIIEFVSNSNQRTISDGHR